MRTIIELPDFETGHYEGCEFNMAKGDALLVLHLSDLPDFRIQFRNVRWHRYTQLYSCDVSMIKDAYFRVIEVSSTELLESFLESDRSDPSQRAYKELHHFRIFLDETGCHEVLAESAFSS